MPNTFKISTLIQNTNAGRGTNQNVDHKVPSFNKTISGYKSAVAEFTGTSTHTIVNDATNISINGNLFPNPITGDAVEATDNIIYGYSIVVSRAVAATAPTGHVRISSDGMCGWLTNGHWKMTEDSNFIWHNPAASATSDGTGISIDMSYGTGYKVSVCIWSK